MAYDLYTQLSNLVFTGRIDRFAWLISSDLDDFGTFRNFDIYQWNWRFGTFWHVYCWSSSCYSFSRPWSSAHGSSSTCSLHRTSGIHQIHFKIFTHSNNERELFTEEIPTSGISKCRDPEHFFYGLSGNWEWSKQTADYWRHHFEIPLLRGNNPFRNVAIDTAPPSGAEGSLTTISTLAGQLSESFLAARASGELGDAWRMVEQMSFTDAIRALQEASTSTPWRTDWSLAKSLYRRYTAIRALERNSFHLFQKRTLLRQGVCVWHICTDVKLPGFVCFFSCRGHRCDSGSCANEDGQKSQWYRRETSLWRTCSVSTVCSRRLSQGPHPTHLWFAVDFIVFLVHCPWWWRWFIEHDRRLYFAD